MGGGQAPVKGPFGPVDLPEHVDHVVEDLQVGHGLIGLLGQLLA